MKRKIFSIVGLAAFAGAVAFNTNVGLSSDAKSDLTLSIIESIAIAGCEASATSCTATCEGSIYCFSYSDGVNCDGNWTGC